MTRKHLVITPDEMRSALERMAELAVADGVELHLRITGGTVMMLEFNTRPFGTNDCDALSAEPASEALDYGRKVASERGWPDGWLNTKASVFEQNAKAPDDAGHEIWRIPGLIVSRPSLWRRTYHAKAFNWRSRTWTTCGRGFDSPIRLTAACAPAASERNRTTGRPSALQAQLRQRLGGWDKFVGRGAV